MSLILPLIVLSTVVFLFWVNSVKNIYQTALKEKQVPLRGILKYYEQVNPKERASIQSWALSTFLASLILVVMAFLLHLGHGLLILYDFTPYNMVLLGDQSLSMGKIRLDRIQSKGEALNQKRLVLFVIQND